MGLTTKYFKTPEVKLSASNAKCINILGVTFLYLAGGNFREKVKATHQMVYVAEDMDLLLLLKEACQALGIIGEDFPMIGSHSKPEIMKISMEKDSLQDIIDLPTACNAT